MRKIKYIAVHCSASPQTVKIAEIKNVFKSRGWSKPGYHYIIEVNGNIVKLLDESDVSNGVKGFNSETINVCYVGGINASGKAVDNRTEKQKDSLLSLLKNIKKRYPAAEIRGHRDFSPDLNCNGKIEPSEYIKMCPCFDAKIEYKNI